MHTPGPWVAKQEFANRWRIESHAKGPEFVPLSVGLACTTILEVGVNNEDTEANAHLIAASPDLLSAVKGLFRAGQKQGWDHQYEREMEAARAAIAKATGQQA